MSGRPAPEVGAPHWAAQQFPTPRGVKTKATSTAQFFPGPAKSRCRSICLGLFGAASQGPHEHCTQYPPGLGNPRRRRHDRRDGSLTAISLASCAAISSGRPTAASAWRRLPDHDECPGLAAPSLPVVEPVAVVVTVPSGNAPTPINTRPIAGEQRSLAQELQGELQRVGCMAASSMACGPSVVKVDAGLHGGGERPAAYPASPTMCCLPWCAVARNGCAASRACPTTGPIRTTAACPSPFPTGHPRIRQRPTIATAACPHRSSTCGAPRPEYSRGCDRLAPRSASSGCRAQCRRRRNRRQRKRASPSPASSASASSRPCWPEAIADSSPVDTCLFSLSSFTPAPIAIVSSSAAKVGGEISSRGRASAARRRSALQHLARRRRHRHRHVQLACRARGQGRGPCAAAPA